MIRIMLAVASAVVLLAGCATTNDAFQQGRAASDAGRHEEALIHYETALKEAPDRTEHKVAVIAARERLTGRLLDQADQARASGRTGDSQRLARRAMQLVPDHARARALLDTMERDRRLVEWQSEAEAALARGDTDTASAKVRAILLEAPGHAPALRLRDAIETRLTKPPLDSKLAAALARTITIEFRDAPIRQVFEALARVAGIDFVFDKDVRPDLRATVFLRDTPIKDAVSTVLLTNQLESRVLETGSILVYPNTPAKAREYQPTTVRSFFMTNGDAKQTAASLRTLLKARDIVVDDKQNMIVLRDSPAAVRLAEKLVALHDLPEPEVMLEVEVLEVKRSKLTDLGIHWPDTLSLTPLPSVAGGALTLYDVLHATSRSTGAGITPWTLNLKAESGDTNVLANPRIRTRNREIAKIMIGERLPNITTTATATGFVAETVQYVDIGLKLDVQPTIYADSEVAIKVNLEVSNIVSQLQTRAGSVAYQIGTRNASTVLRLKDGENQVLAGLISDEDRSTAARVPGMGDMPVVGRLFGSQRDDRQKTEIVLSITPRLVRGMARPDALRAEFDAGTEGALRVAAPDMSTFQEVVPAPAMRPEATTK
jgi:general secretion pathway protein D